MPDFIIPTRDRPAELARTLAALGCLPLGPEDGPANAGTVVVADNASAEPPELPRRLPNGLTVHGLRLTSNRAAASRNAAAAQLTEIGPHPDGWVVMLDDDSHPIPPARRPEGWFHQEPRPPRLDEILARQPADVAAVSADIFLRHPSQEWGGGTPAAGATATRESGGLPEVFVGCGVALRLSTFLDVGGYDAGFDYYAEEYDLAARLIAAGMRTAFEPEFRVLHRKVTTGRDFGRIIARLVRNNGWVAARYAPDDELDEALAEVRSRYLRIAEREGVMDGYRKGAAVLDATLDRQHRSPLRRSEWERFTGLTAAREAVWAAHAARPIRRASLVMPGKNAWVVGRVLGECGAAVRVSTARPGDTLVIATMSPGPMLDAAGLLRVTGRRVVAPWTVAVAAGGEPRRAFSSMRVGPALAGPALQS